jgi:hypothetical protein
MITATPMNRTVANGIFQRECDGRCSGQFRQHEILLELQHWGKLRLSADASG